MLTSMMKKRVYKKEDSKRNKGKCNNLDGIEKKIGERKKKRYA